MWDGRVPAFKPIPDIRADFTKRFARISRAIPPGVELGFHLCYGSEDGKHSVEPMDTRKAVELANLLSTSVEHSIAWVHLPVPASRCDYQYFAPLHDLELAPETELFLGLVHSDGVPATINRMAVARKAVKTFGIACECSMARATSIEGVKTLLKIHADAARMG
jgi:hypothetical protein